MQMVISDAAMIAPPEPPQAHRHIILHYHLFKNAGTSLDRILKKNFKEGWYTHEGAHPGWHSQNIGEYLTTHPEISVLSSHTALLPPPILPDTTVYPVIFIRHPIDRIRSIYEFERKQLADTEGANMAKEKDLIGYIQWRLQRKNDRSIRNFQAYRLAFAVLHKNELTEEACALQALEILPFIGVVEQFDQAVEKLQQWLKPTFPHIHFKSVKANVTQQANTTIEERLAVLKTEIGEEMFLELLEENKTDMLVYETLLDKAKKSP